MLYNTDLPHCHIPSTGCADGSKHYLRPGTVSNRIIKKNANCEFFAIGNCLRIFLAILPVAFSLSGS